MKTGEIEVDKGATAFEELVERVKHDYPELRFVRGRKFAFRPPRTVVLGPEEPGQELLLLHEVGHATLGHRHHNTDVGRLKMEVEAWSEARKLATKYGVKWGEEQAQTELDSYRDWLHRRAACPKCHLTRYQTEDGVWHCPRCENLD